MALVERLHTETVDGPHSPTEVWADGEDLAANATTDRWEILPNRMLYVRNVQTADGEKLTIRFVDEDGNLVERGVSEIPMRSGRDYEHVFGSAWTPPYVELQAPANGATYDLEIVKMGG